jgi:Fe-S cluster assembly protein SufD
MKAGSMVTLPEVARDGFHALRRQARERFIARGWPNRRVEAYKYTSLIRFADKRWRRPDKPGETGPLPEPLGERVLWVDGYTANAAPDERLRLLGDCADAPPTEITALLGRLAPQDDPVVALNTALFDHGAWLDLAPDTQPEKPQSEKPLELVHAFGAHETPSETHSRLAIRLGANAGLTLIERFAGNASDSLLSRVAEIDLAPGAELLHVRINEAGEDVQILGHTSVRVAERANYRCLTLDLGAKLAREAFRIDLAGDGAQTHLDGLAVPSGERHADSDVLITHNATRTVSRQHFRGIVDERGRGVYSGKVRVAAGAQKSNSSQSSANLLLSRRAEADTRPQLEIYADDVVCNHGAATGAIDPDALFYLQSRGIQAEAARRMIAWGFAVRSLAALADHPIKKSLVALLAAHMKAPVEVQEWL